MKELRSLLWIYSAERSKLIGKGHEKYHKQLRERWLQNIQKIQTNRMNTWDDIELSTLDWTTMKRWGEQLIF